MTLRSAGSGLLARDLRAPGEVALEGLKNLNAPSLTRHAAQTQIWVGMIALVVISIQYLLLDVGTASVALEIVIILVICVGSLALNSPTGVWAPAPIFLIVLGVFHLGLAPYWVLGIDPNLPRSADYIWFSGPLGVKSLLLCGLAIVAYTLGVAVSTLHANRPQSLSKFVDVEIETSRTSWFANLGAVILTAGLVVWAFIAYSAGGLGIFVGPYQEFLALTKGSLLPKTYMVLGFGLVLTVMAPIKGLRAFAVGAFLVFAFFAFFLGLRGEILFPLAAAVSVVSLRRRLPPAWVVLIGGVAVLALVNAAKVIRQSGFAGLSGDGFSASPFVAIGELGQSIRVVATTLSWHEVLDEPFRYGATYTVTIARALEALFAPNLRLPASQDFRLMNSEVADRAGAIGGSAVAESYHNFGPIGVIVVFVLLGLVLGAFSKTYLSAWTIALYAAISVPLLNHVRNSFVPVVPAILAGAAAVAVIALIPIGLQLWKNRSRWYRRQK